MMKRIRKQFNLQDMIHHSDRGSQYTSKLYLKMLEDSQIKISMCKEAWQNAYTERINRTIKEEYLNEWDIENHTQLKTALALAVKRYNEERPHWSLPDRMSPVNFENFVLKMPKNRRPEIQVYKAP